MIDDRNLFSPLLRIPTRHVEEEGNRTIQAFEAADDRYVESTFLRLYNDIARRNDTRPPPYPQNVVVSSRYTIFNFLPFCIFEQFRRLANVYFLVLGVIAAVGEYTGIYATSVTAEGMLAPMALVILISIIKDGYEDVKRHQSDAKINAKPARIVSPNGRIKGTLWKELRPGDVVLLTDGDEIPADIIVLETGGIQVIFGFHA